MAPTSDELGATVLEPAMTAAVELEECALGAHPRSPAAIARRASPARAGDAFRTQDRAQALAADGDPLTLGQEFAKVGVVDRPIAFAQLDDPRPPVGVDPPRRRPATVAVDETRRTVTR